MCERHANNHNTNNHNNNNHNNNNNNNNNNKAINHSKFQILTQPTAVCDGSNNDAANLTTTAPSELATVFDTLRPRGSSTALEALRRLPTTPRC